MRRIATSVLSAAICLGASGTASGQCDDARAFEAEVRALGVRMAEPETAGRLLAQASAILADEACVGAHPGVRLIAARLAEATGDWRRLHELSGAALQREAGPAVSRVETRAHWLCERANASYRLVSGEPPAPPGVDLAGDVAVFAEYIGTISRDGRLADPSMWRQFAADALIRNASVVRSGGDFAGAAAAERAGAAFVASFGATREANAALRGFASDEFLQRAATDEIRSGNITQAADTIREIHANPASARHAAMHAQLLLRAARDQRQLGPFVCLLWDRLPHDADTVNLVANAAVVAQPEDEVVLARIVDDCLTLDAAVLDEATRLRNTRLTPARAAATGPVHAHLLMNRAIFAASAGDRALADALVEDVRARGWFGEWCKSHMTRIRFEQGRQR
ncbi:MAG: hypothetical protein SFY69_06875 [Planctomycetota bacterium]|nr:hypothetical protein [Planctomycetota bacterium]